MQWCNAPVHPDGGFPAHPGGRFRHSQRQLLCRLHGNAEAVGGSCAIPSSLDSMRFHLGAVPFSPEFVPDASWKPIREPRPWLLQFIALPIGIVTAALVAVLWVSLTPVSLATFTMPSPSFLISVIGMVVVHEVLHAVVHPAAGCSSHSIIGFWPKCGAFYAHYDGELSRNRFLLIGLMPLFVITISPLLVSAALQTSCGWVAFVSSFNALVASGDVFAAGAILFQIPANATVRNQGWRTYWREHESRAARSCAPSVPPNARAGAASIHCS